MRRLRQAIPKPQRIGARLGRDLALTGLVGFLAIVLLTAAIIAQRFGALEQREIATNTNRLEALLTSRKQLIRGKSLDWAVWTDSYKFVAGTNPGFANENLNLPSLLNYDVSAIYYTRFDGSKSQGLYIDIAEKIENPAHSRQFAQWAQSDLIRERARREQAFETFALVGNHLVAVGVAQVRLGDGTGTPQGYAIIGREVEATALSEQLQQRVVFELAANTLKPSAVVLDEEIRVSVPVSGADRQPLATIHFSFPREVAAAGRNLLIFVAAGIGLLLLVMLAVLSWRLRRAVVAPLVGIEQHLRQIGETGQLALLPQGGRSDEIGSLESGFNAMALQLQALRAELEAKSFELGKNQSAMGVMHNVRNGLSPVFTILSRMHEQLFAASQDNVARAVGELQGENLAPDRRKKLAAFLGAAVSQYDEQLGLCRSRAREAGRNLSSVLEAIAQVQADNGAGAEVHVLLLADVLMPALAAPRMANGRAIRMDADGIDPATQVIGNRVLLAQVIDNLLTNAGEAIAASGREDGVIGVTQQVIELDGRSILRIAIADNGDGFAADQTPQLFERGYSTRSDKVGGLGLHWCANTLNAMGGALSLASDGKGQGATALLALPLAIEAPLRLAS